jgi:hypothetical protein
MCSLKHTLDQGFACFYILLSLDHKEKIKNNHGCLILFSI